MLAHFVRGGVPLLRARGMIALHVSVVGMAPTRQLHSKLDPFLSLEVATPENQETP